MLFPVDHCPPLPFDHEQIVRTALTRLRDKSAYSSLPAFFLQDASTIAELQRVYEQVLGCSLDRTSFRRNLLEQDIIEPIPGQLRQGAHRPAQLYRRHPKWPQLQRTL